MNISIFWARLLGLYTVILSGGVFLDFTSYLSLMDVIFKSQSDLMILGTFTLFLGLAVLVTHFRWHGWAIIITLVGYLITLKGIVLLFYPEFYSNALAMLHTHMRFVMAPSFIIGLILLYFGYRTKI